ncbi:LysE family translocator [Aliikangiella sp. IMCC44359]|uniref:LysE family translocator n=1 Tax=Aliikangiella sp. IMCC44359 TaxID=3459125 RepID=UPI00403ADFB8
MNIETITLFAGIVFIMAVIPGPNALLVLFTALSQNRFLAFTNVVGVAIGFIIHAFISAQGLSFLLTQSSWAFLLLKWLGVVYLLWLGLNNIRAGLKRSALVKKMQSPQTGSFTGSFLKGLLTNLLNPKIVLFYLSIFPQFVSQESILFDSMLLGITHALVVAMWFLVVILLAETFKYVLTTPANVRWLNYISGSIFIAFSAKLANTKI